MIDLLVAGAGPSGLAAAIGAAQAGLTVRIVDPKPATIDKACGEGLMPKAVGELKALGVEPPVYRPFVGIRYQDRHGHVDGDFPGEPGRGVRRTVLHKALADRANALGIDRVVGKIEDPTLHDDHVSAGPHTARWLIAADGLRSPTRRSLGLDKTSRWPRRYGLRRHYAQAPWSDRVEVYWAGDAEAYVTPVADDLVGIAFLFGDDARRRDVGEPGPPFERLLRRFPELQDRLQTPATHVRGAGPFAIASRRQRLGRAFLVGDAAGYLDPLTGEGIQLGLGAARLAVQAIVTGTPAAYERNWRGIYRPYAVSTGGLLTLSRTPARRWMVPTLKRSPAVFDRILAALTA